MQCPHCGAENRPEARFCRGCGKPLPSESPHVVHQVAIGDGNLQVSIGEVHGGVVNIVAPPQRPKVKPRPTPVSVRPRPFPDLLDREAEIGAAAAALPSGAPVEFHAPPGMGKTALLRHLAHHPAASAMPDGVVYLSARQQPVDDLLQALYEAFYESDVPYKPTAVQIEQGLQGKRALVILDDVCLSRDEVAVLMNSAPLSAFLLAAAERCLWGEGQALAVPGLPADDARKLLERELGRALTAEEESAARDLWSRLGGHPLSILQTAGLARERNLPLTQAAQQALAGVGALSGLSEEEQRAAAALAVLGAPVSADHVAAVAAIADARPPLESLVRRSLAQRHSPRYSLTGTLADALQRSWDLKPLEERALSHFTAWAEGNRAAPQRLLESSEPILHVLERAVEAGRWAEVLRLGRALEGALALGGRWGAWLRVLRWILRAAQALGDKAAEGWALHQLGTRALCLGEKDGARDLLTQALRLRESLGDQAGAAVTRHNLGFLAGPPAPPRRPPRPPAKPAPAAGLPTAAKVVLGILGGLAGLALVAAGAVGVIRWLVRERPPVTIAPVTEPPTEPPPQPSVTIELAGGCDRNYDFSARTNLRVTASVAGRAEVWLENGDSRLIEEAIELTPERAWSRPWTFGEFEGRQTDWFRFRAVLYDEFGQAVAEDVCNYHYTRAVEAVDTTPPPAPTLLQPSAQATLACTTQPLWVEFSWQPVSDASGIRYYTMRIESVVYETPIAPAPRPRQFNVDNISADTDLQCGWNYRWQVRAVDRAGNEGPWSDWRYLRVEAVPSTPTPTPSGPTGPSMATIILHNNSGQTVVYAYVSPCSDLTWGDDDLGAYTVPDGSTFTFQVAPGCYDLRAEGSGHTVIEIEMGVEVVGTYDWYVGGAYIGPTGPDLATIALPKTIRPEVTTEGITTLDHPSCPLW